MTFELKGFVINVLLEDNYNEIQFELGIDSVMIEEDIFKAVTKKS